jgi:hypothetical protein
VDVFGLKFYVYIFQNPSGEKYIGKGQGNRVDMSINQRVGGISNVDKGGIFAVNSPCSSAMLDEDYAYLVEALMISKSGFKTIPKGPLTLNENRGRRNASAKRLKAMSKCNRMIIMSSAAKDSDYALGKFQSQASGTGMIKY